MSSKATRKSHATLERELRANRNRKTFTKRMRSLELKDPVPVPVRSFHSLFPEKRRVQSSSRRSLK